MHAVNEFSFASNTFVRYRPALQILYEKIFLEKIPDNTIISFLLNKVHSKSKLFLETTPTPKKLSLVMAREVVIVTPLQCSRSPTQRSMVASS
jgi:hypothetical protein